jgi:superfamily II DNA or RNA helicase
MARKRRAGDGQADLFSLETSRNLAHHLDDLRWPAQARFPINRASARVRPIVWEDLVGSVDPLIVAGYSSVGELVAFIADWDGRASGGQLRIVLGAEPFGSSRRSFASPQAAFTKEVEDYWMERGISLRLSAQVLVAMQAISEGRVAVRVVHGNSPLHAKVYVGDDAATAGSSNFTANGLSDQVEVNARFDRATDQDRFDELSSIADNLWTVGDSWEDELLRLLEQLLRVVTWQEALARACGELLEGEWATDYLSVDGSGLWPSQLVGIAQAMWVIENVGSVLVADATGSGKTKMGAHLVRAVRDRMWATGRARRDLTVLVCPPAVEDTWRREAVSCGLSIDTVSHGRLSRSTADEPRLEQEAVRRAQLLAVDEAHNFLNRTSNRTRFLRDNVADHVLLFTATPISRGATDLLDLVALLGPDNFEDQTHETLQRLEKRGGIASGLTPDEEQQLRSEIQRFTLRRTKAQINELVSREPDAYRHPVTERTCRYPDHHPMTFDTGETESDSLAAQRIRGLSGELRGIALLPRTIAVPKALRNRVTDEQWLRFRTQSAVGLAGHHVLGALRSSRAALHEHLYGTAAAQEAFGLPPGFKLNSTGSTLARIQELMAEGPPEVNLDLPLPEWLDDPDAWVAACEQELERYRAIGAALDEVSDARERTKANVLADLATHHDKVLAFDRHLITLAVMGELLAEGPVEVLIATGQSKAGRRHVEKTFAPLAEGRAIALCSDAMNEGLNLQGAAAMVHLDLPTTLRVAEQRVGRVDRMDSPHDRIEAWWPRDGAAFATRANERLLRRADESEKLLGSNLEIPALAAELAAPHEEIVDVEAIQQEVEDLLARPVDGLFDALDPARRLVTGPDALIGAADYEAYRTSTSRVMARVAPLTSRTPWAFFSVRSSVRGAPRWMLVEPSGDKRCLADLGEVANELRRRLADDPPNRTLDELAARWLDRCLETAAAAEFGLLPRRMQRALHQMATVTRSWASASQRGGQENDATRWNNLATAALPSPDETGPDPFAVAERWLELITPKLDEHRSTLRGRRYVLLDDITPALKVNPLDLDSTEDHFSRLPVAPPLADRVTACILGVPEG